MIIEELQIETWVIIVTAISIIAVLILSLNGLAYNRYTTLRFFFINPINNEDLCFVACGKMTKKYFLDFLGHKLYYDKFDVIPIEYYQKRVLTTTITNDYIMLMCAKLSKNIEIGD